MYSKIALHSLFGQPGFYLIFILSKKKGFQSGAILKTPPSSPPMKEFTVGIQKQISLREAKTYLSEKNKNILKK